MSRRPLHRSTVLFLVGAMKMLPQMGLLVAIAATAGLGLAAGGLPPSASLASSGTAATSTTNPLRCLAFSPYVQGYDPEYGPHPPPSLIDTLLDVVVSQTNFHCILTYGVLNGLDYVFEAARARGMTVIAIIWLDNIPSDAASIAQGIQRAKEYPETIVRLSCGSEIRLRRGTAIAEPIIRSCISQAKAAGVPQPIGYIDTWWEWCNASWPCQQWNLASEVDWIGINVFPWWENEYSGLFPCTTAEQAPDFHVARYQNLIARYPGREVILTEFGWPACPDGYCEQNMFTHQCCGIANQENQVLVARETFARLDQLGLHGVLFEAFREDWKDRFEAPVGSCWGICEGTPPYTCHFALPTPTPTPSSTATRTATKTITPTVTRTATQTATGTRTPTATRTPTPSRTATPTAVPSATQTPLPTRTETASPTATLSPTCTNTPTPAASHTDTPTHTPVPTAAPTSTPTSTATTTPTRWHVWLPLVLALSSNDAE